MGALDLLGGNLNYKRWVLVGYLSVMMVFTFLLLSSAGNNYTILTTSDSGYFYTIARDITETGIMSPIDNLSHAPTGLPISGGDYLQPLITAMMYKGAQAVNPGVSLMDIVQYYSPLIFALSLIPIFLIGKELGGNVAGCSAVLFASTIVNLQYWSKIGAFDREMTQVFFAAWTFYLVIKMFKAPRNSIPKFALLAGLVYALFALAWSGALYIAPIIVLALIFVALNEGLPHWRSGPEKVIWRGIRSGLPLILGVLGMLFVMTIMSSGLAGYSVAMWPGLAVEILGFLGIGGGGINFGGYATEMVAPVDYSAYLQEFYRDAILTTIVLIFVAIAIIKIFLSRKRSEFLLLSWFIVLAVMATAQARFFRPWWVMLPVIAGLGVAVVAKGIWWVLTSPSAPGSDFVGVLKKPVVIATCIVLFAIPFIQNARDSATPSSPTPHGGTSPAVYYSLLDSYYWLKENSPEDAIVAVEWSYGHLLAGVADRQTLVDGADVKGEVGTWENVALIQPPDYIYQLTDSTATFIGGRRLDMETLYYTTSDIAFEDVIRSYRDEYNCEIDYIVFNLDVGRVFSGLYEAGVGWQNADSVNPVPGGRVYGFDNVQVTFNSDQWVAAIQDGENTQYLAGVLYRDIAYGSFGYNLYPNPDVQKILLVLDAEGQPFINETLPLFGAQMADFPSVPMLARARSSYYYDVFGDNHYKLPDFLEEAYASPSGYAKVYKINHVPSLKSPNDGVATNDNQPTFEWFSAAGAVRYKLQVDNDQTFNSPEITIDNLSDLTYTSTITLADESYSWQVGAFNDENDFLGWSSIYAFTLDTQPPEAPTPAEPVDGSAINDNTPTFEWSFGIGTDNYRVLVDNDVDFGSPEVDALVSALENTYTTTTELAEETYYWIVIAYDMAGNENISSIYAFSIDIQPPATPTLVSPSDNSILSDNTPTLEWSPSIDADSYRVLVDNDDDFSSPEVDNLISAPASTYTPTVELQDDNYWWKIIARDVAGNESSSSVWMFTIET